MNVELIYTVQPGDTLSAITLSPNADVMGYWHWTYSQAAAPSNARLSLAFSGYADPQNVINNANGRIICR